MALNTAIGAEYCHGLCSFQLGSHCFASVPVEDPNAARKDSLLNLSLNFCLQVYCNDNI